MNVLNRYYTKPTKDVVARWKTPRAQSKVESSPTEPVDTFTPSSVDGYRWQPPELSSLQEFGLNAGTTVLRCALGCVPLIGMVLTADAGKDLEEVMSLKGERPLRGKLASAALGLNLIGQMALPVCLAVAPPLAVGIGVTTGLINTAVGLVADSIATS